MFTWRTNRVNEQQIDFKSFKITYAYRTGPRLRGEIFIAYFVVCFARQFIILKSMLWKKRLKRSYDFWDIRSLGSRQMSQSIYNQAESGSRTPTPSTLPIFQRRFYRHDVSDTFLRHNAANVVCTRVFVNSESFLRRNVVKISDDFSFLNRVTSIFNWRKQTD